MENIKERIEKEKMLSILIYVLEEMGSIPVWIGHKVLIFTFVKIDHIYP